MMWAHLYSVIRVDLFSLDIEGAEYDVLQTIPWDKMNIDALLIEVILFQQFVKNWKLSQGKYFDFLAYRKK